MIAQDHVFSNKALMGLIVSYVSNQEEKKMACVSKKWNGVIKAVREIKQSTEKKEYLKKELEKIRDLYQSDMKINEKSLKVLTDFQKVMKERLEGKLYSSGSDFNEKDYCVKTKLACYKFVMFKDYDLALRCSEYFVVSNKEFGPRFLDQIDSKSFFRDLIIHFQMVKKDDCMDKAIVLGWGTKDLYEEEGS